MGITNCGGTAILIKHNITHHCVQISTLVLENTVIYLHINAQELRLGSIYKSPNSDLLHSVLNLLLDSTANTILAGDLSAKNKMWYSHTTYLVGLSLENHIESNDYIIIASNTLTYYSDIHHHRKNVFDIALIKFNDINIKLENLNHLSSNHNPIMLDIEKKNRQMEPSIGRKILTN